MNDNFIRFSSFVNKNFKDITSEDIISFLNTLRKSETEDSNHKWIGTYNLLVIMLGTFFKWFYYPKTEPIESPKPQVLDNIKQLKRKEMY